MSTKGIPLNNRLVIKQQWVCDVCGGVILSDQDGMLEWSKVYTASPPVMSVIQKGFQIVHGRWTEQCLKNRSEDDDLADGHLHWYTGPDGLNKLLGKLLEPGTDQASLVEIIRRLHVDLYEEARTLIPRAIEDGYDVNEYGYVPENDLDWIIRKYKGGD